MSFLEKLVGLLVDRLLQERREFREERVRKKLVFLLEALFSCHNAYKAFKADQKEETFLSWRSAVEDLILTLDSLRTTLATISPDSFDAVYAYAGGEARVPPRRKIPEQDRELWVDQGRKEEELLRLLGNMSVLRSEVMSDDMGDIRTAIGRLKAAINERLSDGEIYSAQAAFKRGAR